MKYEDKLPTMAEITNLYLYKQKNTPTEEERLDFSKISTSEGERVYIDINLFMAGRDVLLQLPIFCLSVYFLIPITIMRPLIMKYSKLPLPLKIWSEADGIPKRKL